MLRRLLLAVLLAASMTLSGISSCDSSFDLECQQERRECGLFALCCEELTCIDGKCRVPPPWMEVNRVP